MRASVEILSLVVGLGYLTPALAQNVPNSLDEARKTFIQAYDTRDYPLFCSILDKDVVFRGALDPAQWTFTADEVIKRFRAPCTCTQYQAEPKCGTSAQVSIEARVRPFSIVNTDLELTPTAPLATDNPNIALSTHAMDTGTFKMQAKLNTDGVSTEGQYELFWVKVGNDWKLKHMDMKRTGN